MGITHANAQALFIFTNTATSLVWKDIATGVTDKWNTLRDIGAGLRDGVVDAVNLPTTLMMVGSGEA